MNYTKNQIIEYNNKKQKLQGISMITGAVMIIIIAIYFYFSTSTIANYAGIITKHIIENTKKGSMLGALYTSTIGGLFFVIMPNEILYMQAVRNNPWPIIMTITILGYITSYTINYYIGQKFSNAAKKLITTKKFYKTKSLLNKYGKWAILGINALPLPSQPLAAILGVFNYNKARFYTFFITGQIIKAISLTIIIYYMT